MRAVPDAAHSEVNGGCVGFPGVGTVCDVVEQLVDTAVKAWSGIFPESCDDVLVCRDLVSTAEFPLPDGECQFLLPNIQVSSTSVTRP